MLFSFRIRSRNLPINRFANENNTAYEPKQFFFKSPESPFNKKKSDFYKKFYRKKILSFEGLRTHFKKKIFNNFFYIDKSFDSKNIIQKFPINSKVSGGIFEWTYNSKFRFKKGSLKSSGTKQLKTFLINIDKFKPLSASGSSVDINRRMLYNKSNSKFNSYFKASALRFTSKFHNSNFYFSKPALKNKKVIFSFFWNNIKEQAEHFHTAQVSNFVKPFVYKEYRGQFYKGFIFSKIISIMTNFNTLYSISHQNKYNFKKQAKVGTRWYKYNNFIKYVLNNKSRNEKRYLVSSIKNCSNYSRYRKSAWANRNINFYKSFFYYTKKHYLSKIWNKNTKNWTNPVNFWYWNEFQLKANQQLLKKVPYKSKSLCFKKNLMQNFIAKLNIEFHNVVSNPSSLFYYTKARQKIFEDLRSYVRFKNKIKYIVFFNNNVNTCYKPVFFDTANSEIAVFQQYKAKKISNYYSSYNGIYCYNSKFFYLIFFSSSKNIKNKVSVYDFFFQFFSIKNNTNLSKQVVLPLWVKALYCRSSDFNRYFCSTALASAKFLSVKNYFDFDMNNNQINNIFSNENNIFNYETYAKKREKDMNFIITGLQELNDNDKQNFLIKLDKKKAAIAKNNTYASFEGQFYNFVKFSRFRYLQIFRLSFVVNLIIFSVSYFFYSSSFRNFFVNLFCKAYFIKNYNFIFVNQNVIHTNINNSIYSFSSNKRIELSKENWEADEVILFKNNQETFLGNFEFRVFNNTYKNNFINIFNPSILPLISYINKYIRKQSIQIIVKPLKNNTYCTISPYYFNMNYKKFIFNKSVGDVCKVKGAQRRSSSSRRSLYSMAAFSLLRFGNKAKRYRFSIFRPRHFHATVGGISTNPSVRASKAFRSFKGFFIPQNQRRFPLVYIDPIHQNLSFGDTNRAQNARRKRRKKAPKWLIY